MPLSVNLTEGPILVGILIATFLYGIATLQTYNYYREYGKDPPRLKILVACVWLLETALTVLTCTYLYTVTVTNSNNPSAYDMLPWTVAIIFLTGGLLGAVVQSFFAWRVYMLSGHLLPSIVSWSGGLARIGVTAAMCGFVIQTGSRKLYEERYGWSIDLVLGIALFVDVFNTGCMCYYLSRKQNKDNKIQVIDKIMIWTIETGLVTRISPNVKIIILELDDDVLERSCGVACRRSIIHTFKHRGYTRVGGHGQ
ncbi:hypothetical protein WOLCODRAFT_21314 [Wolfiporia cocos MD-104 SS10]|uniref:DUF6534 domain-containing protein n=1 Tax=Wolfiporia cocos (strain MD-104) TaxID=742152 RepID=A0A2H3JJS0_WOLCO|nr:hypothetical protein WOLCODRAFT_21314 [Wolfiporia cocos MD-104 SS10]